MVPIRVSAKTGQRGVGEVFEANADREKLYNNGAGAR